MTPGQVAKGIPTGEGLISPVMYHSLAEIAIRHWSPLTTAFALQYISGLLETVIGYRNRP